MDGVGRPDVIGRQAAGKYVRLGSVGDSAQDFRNS